MWRNWEIMKGERKRLSQMPASTAASEWDARHGSEANLDPPAPIRHFSHYYVEQRWATEPCRNSPSKQLTTQNLVVSNNHGILHGCLDGEFWQVGDGGRWRSFPGAQEERAEAEQTWTRKTCPIACLPQLECNPCGCLWNVVPFLWHHEVLENFPQWTEESRREAKNSTIRSHYHQKQDTKLKTATCCKAETSFLKVCKKMCICQPRKNSIWFKSIYNNALTHLFLAPWYLYPQLNLGK